MDIMPKSINNVGMISECKYTNTFPASLSDKSSYPVVVNDVGMWLCIYIYMHRPLCIGHMLGVRCGHAMTAKGTPLKTGVFLSLLFSNRSNDLLYLPHSFNLKCPTH